MIDESTATYSLSGQDITAATHGYVTCALWTEAVNSYDGDDTSFLSAGYGEDSLYPDALTMMREDVVSFVSTGHEQHDADVYRFVQEYGAEQVGHDLWLTRNGHGTGFWDRGAGETGERLTEMAHPMGESSLYLGDDGMIYVQ